MNARPLLAAALGALMLFDAAYAAEPAPIESTIVAKTGTEPPEPGGGNADWVQLTSGEWLKGRLHSMRQNRIDFDSEKLDQLTLKWKDVRAVFTAQSMAVMQQNNTVATGRLRTIDGQLVLDDGARIDHDAVISIARSAEREPDRWFGDVAVGFNLRDGNVDQRDININVDVRRRTAKSTVAMTYVSNYSEFDSEQNANDQRFNLSYDYRLSRYWFVRPVTAEYFRDPFQNIARRITVGPGIGYFLIEEPDQSWFVVTGPAYQKTQFTEAPAGQEDSASSVAGFIATTYEQELTSTVDLQFQYQFFLTDDKSGHTIHHLMTAVDVDLTKALDLRVTGYWDFIEKPQPETDGTMPEREDFRVVVGLDWEL
jgi:hypothetical protein